jgi:hypothetical protein
LLTIGSQISSMENHVMSRPPRLTVKLLGTYVSAEGALGIAGAIVVILVILLLYPVFVSAAATLLN